MIYNQLISDKLQADKQLAILLDKGVQGSGRMALEQANKIASGFTRLTWYSSCFFENYQDVCSNLKHEDIRFIKALVKLTLHPDVVFNIVQIMVKDMLGGQSEEKINKIHLILLQKGAGFASSRYTSKAFTFSISTAICSGFGMRIAIDSFTTSVSKWGVLAVGVYSYVKVAADAASRLKSRKPMVYAALYQAELEMLYFIIEPIFSKIDTTSYSMKSENEIASDIMRLIK
ncbi:hypothetical protein [Pantoea sp. BAV 3049]|uniref:hypothetical protein n=1 Tax=Pantoea sp. BAV 3049 TaxID=2654188 RepID=UPI00131D853F|nr:hypothetical protein [Pantoea sp. BAV 3049]